MNIFRNVMLRMIVFALCVATAVLAMAHYVDEAVGGVVGGLVMMLSPFIAYAAVAFGGQKLFVHVGRKHVETESQNAQIAQDWGLDGPLVGKARQEYVAGDYGPIEFTLRVEALMDLWAAQKGSDWRPWDPIEITGDWTFNDQMQLVRRPPPSTAEQMRRIGIKKAAEQAQAKQKRSREVPGEGSSFDPFAGLTEQMIQLMAIPPHLTDRSPGDEYAIKAAGMWGNPDGLAFVRSLYRNELARMGVNAKVSTTWLRDHNGRRRDWLLLVTITVWGDAQHSLGVKVPYSSWISARSMAVLVTEAAKKAHTAMRAGRLS